MKKLLCGMFLAAAVVFAGRSGAEDKKPKEISEIMEEAHGGGMDSLRAKVLTGKAEAAQAKKLLSLYEELAKNKPPKGSAEAWKKKTDAILAAAKKVAAKPSDPDALKELNKATICANCHKEHKP